VFCQQRTCAGVTGVASSVAARAAAGAACGGGASLQVHVTTGMSCGSTEGSSGLVKPYPRTQVHCTTSKACYSMQVL
jgi:hypothetical protein